MKQVRGIFICILDRVVHRVDSSCHVTKSSDEVFLVVDPVVLVDNTVEVVIIGAMLVSEGATFGLSVLEFMSQTV